MIVLVINAGSSSVKFTCMESENLSVLAGGMVERIGLPGTLFTYKRFCGACSRFPVEVNNAHEAFHLITSMLMDEKVGVIKSLDEIKAVGHRVVHGGETITASVVIDEEVRSVIEQCSELAPLHNPPNMEGIRACEKVLPGIPQVGVFDTAFHAKMPPRAYLYALPYRLYHEAGIRRYGFHGTSHRYVARQAALYFDKPAGDLKLVTCHLGNGCSISAVVGDRSIDTSMGFTPLEGLIMGTRSGDIDPAVIFYLMDRKKMTASEVSEMLNKQSGLLGLAGIGSSDMRDIEEKAGQGHIRAKACMEAFCYRIRKYIGAYMAAMGGLDGIIFTGGIGENSKTVRFDICREMEGLGIALDPEMNEALNRLEGEIQKPGSPVKILIIHTDEELEIARETLSVLNTRNEEFVTAPESIPVAESVLSG